MNSLCGAAVVMKCLVQLVYRCVCLAVCSVVLFAGRCHGMDTGGMAPETAKQLACLLDRRPSAALVSQGRLLYYDQQVTMAAVHPDERWEESLISLVGQFGSTAVVTSTDNRGQMPVHLAAAYQGMGPLALLLLSYGANPNSRDVMGRTPLHVAARSGNLPAIKLLVGRGAAIDARDKAGAGVLHHAVCSGRSDIVALLAGCGADSTAVDSAGRRPIDVWYEVAHTMDLGEYHGLRGQMARVLADADNGLAPLVLEETERRRSLVDQRSRGLGDLGELFRTSLLPILEADNRAYIAACEKFMRGRYAQQFSASVLCPALLQAEERGRQELLASQLAQRAELTEAEEAIYEDVQRRGEERRARECEIATIIAAEGKARKRLQEKCDYWGYRPLWRRFVNEGGCIILPQLRGVVANECDARTEIEYARYLERAQLVERERLQRRELCQRPDMQREEAQARDLLLRTFVSKLPRASRPGLSPAMSVASASPSVRTPLWWAQVQIPFIQAAKNNDIVAAEAGLAAGAHLSCWDRDGVAPEHHAAANDAADVLQLFIKTNSSCRLTRTKWTNETPLHVAVREGRESAVGALLSHDERDEYARKGVFIMLRERDADKRVAFELTEDGSPIRERLDVAFENGDMRRSQPHADILAGRWEGLRPPTGDRRALRTHNRGMTPLQAACCQGSADCVRAVLRTFGGLIERDKRGRLPLHTAAQRNKFDAVHELLGREADPAVKDSLGKMPLDLAPEGSGVARLLATTNRFNDQCGRPSGATMLRIDRLLGQMKMRYPIIYAAAYAPLDIVRDFVRIGASRDILRAALRVAHGFERDEAIITCLREAIEALPEYGGRRLKR